MDSDENKSCCGKNFKKKLEDFRTRMFVCLLYRCGIVTPTIFR